ncbi:13595_t:CDS:2, partial [Entrophospora sp. SA101]
VHLNKGRNVSHKLSFETVLKVLTFLKSYANLNGLPSPGRHFERATKAIIYLPTRDNYTEIHEKFLNDIGTGSEHHISYSSFFNL